MLICLLYDDSHNMKSTKRQDVGFVARLVTGTMNASLRVIGIDIMMCKVEYLLHIPVSTIVKDGAPVIMMDFVLVTVVAISSMHKVATKART